ncbi:hypothetical protein [Rhizobium chutanense]|uniref:Uncharacterized protein n=1 Tax=Rhizobium chutanense TaxID=2035448 RepID=A0A432NC74_9HYPH|nr:hypothetical protein [Rhizobium chutanense]RUL97208.1 hypothetical protein EFR84_31135 [Rhizobium chutanense]
MLSRCMISAVVLLAASSSAVAAVQGRPVSEPPSDPGAPWAIEWLTPDLKDAATPKTLILCSDDMAEHLRRYRSLIEKLSELKGHTVLDGSKLGARKPAGTIGYIVSAHRGNEDKVSDCVANYPELQPVVTDFTEREISAEQNEFQNLIKFGILPKEVKPRECFGRYYYPTEDYNPTRNSTGWFALVEMDYSSDDRCFEESFSATFGIDPDSCRLAGICVDDKK